MENKFKGISGIYKISTTTNSRIYIGSASDLYARYHRHKHDLSKNKHCNNRLQNYVNKYGFHCISFEVVELCKKQDLTIREQRLIDELKPYYNICQIAGNTLGLKMSDTQKKYLSDMRKGKYPQHLKGTNNTKEAREKISVKAKIRGLHPSFKAASKLANTGKKHSKELRDRIALTQSKIQINQVSRIIEENRKGVRQVDLAKRYNVSQRVISRVINGVGIYQTMQQKLFI